jgi:RNA polymerase sigma-70 factor (ECF subfamily)
MDDADPLHSLVDTSAARRAARVRAAAQVRRGVRRMTPGDDAAAEDPSAWISDIAVSHSRERYALLFSRFAPRVKSYLIRLGARPELAEDLAQETLLTVWRKAASFDPNRASASTWIFTIARNLRIDALRRERHPEDLEHEPGLAPEPPPSPDAALTTLQRLDRVRQALGGLSADQVEVVRLSFFEDKPHSEISADLGLPLGTVKSRLRLAMARLRAQLGDLL